jgi:hypothetical protein
MNPEFRRQLWLQFSSTRVVLMPLLLAACFAAVYLSAQQFPAHPLALAGSVLFAVLVGGMATLAAGASVMDEITDRTWDQQRMCAMQPWTMTWGKLAGSTAYGWYGGALCLLVAVPSALLIESPEVVLRVGLGAVLTGVFLQSLLISVNLQLAKVGGRFSRRSGVWTVAVVLLWGVGPVVGMFKGQGFTWWGVSFDPFDFALASIALFASCALCAAWRSMAEVLSVRQWPWGWAALALVTTGYLAGFASDYYLPALGVFGVLSCAVLTYFALLTEPQQRPMWQRVVTRCSSGQWRSAVMLLPRWPTTLALAVPFALLTAFSMYPTDVSRWGLAQNFALHPLTAVVLMARDCALALFFAFNPKARRPLLAFFVLMLVLYGLVPWFLGAAGATPLVGLALPWLAHGGLSIAAALVHLALAMGLLRWRWMATSAQ